MKVAVLVSGGGTNLQALLDAKAAGRLPEAEFVSVISNRKDAYALERAKAAGISAEVLSKRKFASNEEYDIALRDLLLAKGAELVVLAGFLVVLGPAVLQAYHNRILNIHPSLIPSFCGDGAYGLRVHEMALARGVKVTGATVHFVDEGTDTGPILLQKAVAIHEGDTPESLQLRVMQEAEWQLLPKAVDLFTRGKVHFTNGIAWIDEQDS